MGRNERLRELAGAHRIAISFGEPMAGHTSLRIGGPADVALLPNEEALKALIPFLHDAHIPYVVIGKGSNVLVADEGIRGAVIWTNELGDLAFDAGGDATVSTRAASPLKKVFIEGLEPGDVERALTPAL